MKKILYLFVFCLCFFLITILPSSATGGVLCTSDRSVCTVGRYTLYGLNIQAKNGIMCNSSGTMCTNGYSVYYGSGVSKQKSSSQVKEEKKTVKKDNSLEILQILSELYNRGLIVQSEFNIAKANLSALNLSEIKELKNIANLYKNNMISQCQYNRLKNELLR